MVQSHSTLKRVFRVQTKPERKEKKESPKELSHIKSTTAQYRIDPVPFFPKKIIPIQSIFRFQMTNHRLNRSMLPQPSPCRSCEDSFPLVRKMHCSLPELLLYLSITSVTISLRWPPPALPFRLFYRLLQRMAIVGIPMNRIRRRHRTNELGSNGNSC